MRTVTTIVAQLSILPALVGSCYLLPDPHARPVPWAVDANGRELPLPVAHNEQGDFLIIAPDVAMANWIYAQAVMAGVPVEMPNAATVTGKLLCPNHWLWWWDLRPKLTGCIVSGGAEGRPTRT